MMLFRDFCRALKFMLLLNGIRFFVESLLNPTSLTIRKFARIPLAKRFAGFGKTGVEKDPGQIDGTNLKILKYPHPLLRTNNENITKFDDELKQTAKEMLLLMYAFNGIGLAAPQVGINKRLMVFNGQSKATDKDVVLANPTILQSSAETDVDEEGCLSFPMIHGKVTRHKWIEVEFQDTAGVKCTRRFADLEARVFQHEYDHLQKVLFIDRFDEKDKEKNNKKLEKYIKKYGPGAAI